MADFLGVQEVSTEPWYDAENSLAAFKTSSGWCAFWKKRPQGLPVETASSVTIQVACTVHSPATPAGHPGLLETTVSTQDCELSDLRELLLRSGERDEVEVPFSAPPSALQSWSESIEGMNIPAGTPFVLFFKVKHAQTSSKEDSLEFKNEEKFRKAHRERTIGNEGVKQAAWQVADMHYKQAIDTLDTLFAPIDTQPRLKEASDALRLAVHSNMALVYSKQGKHSDAVDACSRVLAVDPKHTKALFRRASANFALGRLDDAQADSKVLAALQVDSGGTGKVTTSVAQLLHRIATARAQDTAAAKKMAGAIFGSGEGGPRKRKGAAAGKGGKGAFGTLYEDMHDYGEKTNVGDKHPTLERCRRRWRKDEDSSDPVVQCTRAGDGMRLMFGGEPAYAHWCSCATCLNNGCAALTLDCVECGSECSADCGWQPACMRCVRASDERCTSLCTQLEPFAPTFKFLLDKVFCGLLMLMWFGYVWAMERVGQHFSNPNMLQELQQSAADHAKKEAAEKDKQPVLERKGVVDSGSDSDSDEPEEQGVFAGVAQPDGVLAAGSDGAFDIDQAN